MTHKMMDITLSEETYAIIHKLAADRMDDLLSVYDECDQVPYEAQRILEAVTFFSSWNRGAVEELAQGGTNPPPPDPILTSVQTTRIR